MDLPITDLQHSRKSKHAAGCDPTGRKLAGESLRDTMLPKPALITLPSRQLCGLLISLFGLLLMGGSARPDAQSLAVLNPFTILCCAGGLLLLKREELKDKRISFLGFFVVFLLIAAYLIPWTGRSGTSLLSSAHPAQGAMIDKDPAQAIAVAPATAWQSLFFLFAPFSIFLFAVQLDREDLRRTVPLIIVLGTVSGILGILQLAGSANSPLYFYDITNSGSAVGLFANRNHAAVFLACLFPVLAIFAVRSRASVHESRASPQMFAVALLILLIPLILVTGSRSGMLSGILGIAGGALLYTSHAPSDPKATVGKLAIPLLVIAVLVCLVFATIYLSRAEAVERLFAEPNNAVDRTDFWGSSLRMFWEFFPLGFGPGGFGPAFQVDQPLDLLAGAYLNRLHNDWLETALTFGVPGIIFMAVGVAYYLYRSYVLWFRMDHQRWAVALGRMASIVIAILALASVSDYPLRTPAMAGFGALVLVWFAHASTVSKRS